MRNGKARRGRAAAVAQKPHRTNGKVIAGGCMAMMGFWGNVIIYIASRFVEVMIPRKVWSTDRSTWQYRWNSNVTGHSWKYFVQKYDLEWLVAALTVLLIVGVVCMYGSGKRSCGKNGRSHERQPSPGGTAGRSPARAAVGRRSPRSGRCRGRSRLLQGAPGGNWIFSG